MHIIILVRSSNRDKYLHRYHFLPTPISFILYNYYLYIFFFYSWSFYFLIQHHEGGAVLPIPVPFSYCIALVIYFWGEGGICSQVFPSLPGFVTAPYARFPLSLINKSHLILFLFLLVVVIEDRITLPSNVFILTYSYRLYLTYCGNSSVNLMAISVVVILKSFGGKCSCICNLTTEV